MEGRSAVADNTLTIKQKSTLPVGKTRQDKSSFLSLSDTYLPPPMAPPMAPPNGPADGPADCTADGHSRMDLPKARKSLPSREKVV